VHPVNRKINQALRLFLFFYLYLVVVHASGMELSHEQAAVHRSNLAPIQIEIGKQLFFDKRLSKNGTISCATCHAPEKAFSDGLPVAKGIDGKLGVRNTPSLFNVRFNTSQFWDGRRESLEQQARDPLLNPSEHGFDTEKDVLNAVRRIPAYQNLFISASGNQDHEITMQDLTSALAAFERTLVSGRTPFDRYYFDKDDQALSESAKRGYRLFAGAARCVECHQIGTQEALFTDQQFHGIQFALQKIRSNVGSMATQIARMSPDERSKVAVLDKDFAALGRFIVTTDPKDIGSFKTPSLRNVAVTAPYMHDGSVPSLKQAVAQEVRYRQRRSSDVFILTIEESSDLVSFLEALTAYK